ncbi:hypothetical protein ACFOHK_08290 [Falsigemmobacter intermedius]|uniref:Uncharacterized protein n=1 Tax=Falsigemmobacter intermedius TaxID=1553448 RepID=A0A3S3U924_9RHOB|nr:hypothetical protein [Falsigemmobacter intermedius]RWY37122.1 hypothetical protein EP867_17545 [Falsigemmobacter intermedius]
MKLSLAAEFSVNIDLIFNNQTPPTIRPATSSLISQEAPMKRFDRIVATSALGVAVIQLAHNFGWLTW